MEHADEIDKQHPGPALLRWLLVPLAVIGAQLWYYAPRLPDTVASHFDLAGEPDGWMAKDDFLLMIAGVVVGIAALFAFLIWLVPRVPDSAVNLPNRGYWLAAPRRAATHASIGRYLLAFALLTLGFVAALLHETWRFHSARDGDAAMTLWWPLIPYLVAMTIAVIAFYRRFRRPAGVRGSEPDQTSLSG